MLMRGSVKIFGLSHIALRLPALVGCSLFLIGTATIISLLRPSTFIWILAVLSLSVNPFLLDYFVAARGYGLSIGFQSVLLANLGLISLKKQSPSRLGAACVGAALAFSIAANFGSLYVASCLTASYLVCISTRTSKLETARLALLCLSVAILTLFVFCGSVILNFPREQLFWGAKSYGEMFVELFDANYQKLNLFITEPIVEKLLHYIRPIAPYAWLLAILTCCVRLLSSIRNRQQADEGVRLFSMCLAGVLIASLGAHALQFVLFGVPLPFERTSIFFVPLFYLLLCSASRLVASPFRSLSQILICLPLLLSAMYFPFAIRDTYFREWAICADIREAYPTIRAACEKSGCGEVVSDLNYTSSINVYRIMDGSGLVPELQNYDAPPPGRLVYVLPKSQYADFIKSERLISVFNGKWSDFSVLVRAGESGQK
jgi:hypothetical protein